MLPRQERRLLDVWSIGPVQNISAKRIANRTWVGVMPIGRDSLGCMTNHLNGLLEKALGRIHISLFAEH